MKDKYRIRHLVGLTVIVHYPTGATCCRGCAAKQYARDQQRRSDGSENGTRRHDARNARYQTRCRTADADFGVAPTVGLERLRYVANKLRRVAQHQHTPIVHVQQGVHQPPPVVLGKVDGVRQEVSTQEPGAFGAHRDLLSLEVRGPMAGAHGGPAGETRGGSVPGQMLPQTSLGTCRPSLLYALSEAGNALPGFDVDAVEFNVDVGQSNSFEGFEGNI